MRWCHNCDVSTFIKSIFDFTSELYGYLGLYGLHFGLYGLHLGLYGFHLGRYINPCI